jgi:hypothetical protein
MLIFILLFLILTGKADTFAMQNQLLYSKTIGSGFSTSYQPDYIPDWVISLVFLPLSREAAVLKSLGLASKGLAD